MLNVSLRKEFIYRHRDNCSLENLYYHFDYYFNRYLHWNKHCVEEFGDCIVYLKRILDRYRPEECIEALCRIEGVPFHVKDVEESYMYLMYTVVKLQSYHKDYERAAHWARKAVDMVDYFHPLLNEAGRKKLNENNFYYSECLKDFEKYKNHFDKELHVDVVFAWEMEFFFPTVHANQNFKYRLYT